MAAPRKSYGSTIRPWQHPLHEEKDCNLRVLGGMSFLSLGTIEGLVKVMMIGDRTPTTIAEVASDFVGKIGRTNAHS